MVIRDKIRTELTSLIYRLSFRTFKLSTNKIKYKSVGLLLDVLPNIIKNAPRFIVLLEQACSKYYIPS